MSEDSLAVIGRTRVLQNASFQSIDINKDSRIDYQDFAVKTIPYYEYLMRMIKEGNGKWIWNNYFRVTIA